MSTKRGVKFSSTDGLKLAGFFYSAGDSRPCIVVSNGFTGTKEAFLTDFAERFQAAGYGVLLYDNRCWGESEGSPRNESDPVLQTRDYFAAFEFAASLSEVDASKIVLWGTSLSGGNVICAAAIDKRVAAVISQTPFVSGEMVTAGLGPKTGALVYADRGQCTRGGSPMMIPVVPYSIEEVESGKSSAVLAVLAAPDIFPFLAELDRRQVKWEKQASMQSLFYMQSHEPMAFIDRVSPRPLLMVVGDQDVVIPTTFQLKMYAKAQEPKRLHVLRGVGHFGLYHGAGFEENVRIQCEFLKDVL